MTSDRTPSATVKFYDMSDGTVMTEVDMNGGYKGTPAQKISARIHIIDCRQCDHITRKMSCSSIIKCVGGSQYKSTFFVKLFLDEDA